MADAPDSKSGGVHPREGSSPSSGTTISTTYAVRLSVRTTGEQRMECVPIGLIQFELK
jgi:hypothetical protein